MPKRSFDASPMNMSLDRAQKKTERSHEENQERAYIAASRRADRSIEARVQSARMASEIHKKRTGKGFKISEEIVMKEEMYEEEEDDLPRHYRALAAHLQTSSSEMNHRLSAYLTNQVAMASMARQQEVNRMFAEQFPNASKVSQQLAQSMYYQPLQTTDGSLESSASPSFQPMGFPAPSQPFQRDRSQSIPPSSEASPRPPAVATHSPSPILHQASIDDRLSPPALTPGSGSTETTQSYSTPTFPASQAYLPGFGMTPPPSGLPIDPSLSRFPPVPIHSSFTTELPTEAKLMANIDMSDPLAGVLLGGEPMGGDSARHDMYTDDAAPLPVKEQSTALPEDYFGIGICPTSRLLDLPGQRSTIGTPGGGAGDCWDIWVNTDQWSQLEPEEH